MTIPRAEANTTLRDFEEKIRAMADESIDAKRRFFEQSGRDVALAARMIIESMRAGSKLLIFGSTSRPNWLSKWGANARRSPPWP